jgi:asparagine synthase (glutamine-hydrolysing)
MVRLQDEPIADPVCVPVYYVSKLARDNDVIVAQVGEGADELFNGYPWWQQYLRLERYNDLPVPRVLKRAGLAGMRGLGDADTRKYELLRRGSLGQPVFWSGAEAFVQARKAQLLSPRMREQFDGRTSWEALQPTYERFRTKAWETSDLNWMTYTDLSHRLPELLLMRVDKMSMGVSLEGRVPFLDHQFVALAMSIPTEVKLRNGTLKHILKKAVRGVIPDELIDRPKQGFGVPVFEWYQDRLGARIREDVDDFNRSTDFLDDGAVSRVLQSNDGTSAWILHNLAMWWKEYIA